MSTYGAGITVALSLPNKLKAKGQPAGNAVWRNVIIPAGVRFTFYSGAGIAWLTTLCDANPNLTKES